MLAVYAGERAHHVSSPPCDDVPTRLTGNIGAPTLGRIRLDPTFRSRLTMDRNEVSKRKAALWPIVIIMVSVGAQRIGETRHSIALLIFAILMAFLGAVRERR